MHPIVKLATRISSNARKERIQAFLDLFQPDEYTRMLDVGGLPGFWREVPIKSHITFLNPDPLSPEQLRLLPPNQVAVVGDGTLLPYEDNSFDIVFSNSVIEHVTTAARQEEFAREMRRVGKSYWVQTPAKEFFIEPHYLLPVVHWFSKGTQKRLLPYFVRWGWHGRPNARVLQQMFEELRLLTRKEFKQLYPDAQFLTERFLGWPKSYTAYQLGRPNS